MSRSMKFNPAYGPKGRDGRYGETHRSDSKRAKARQAEANSRRRQADRKAIRAALAE
jgi:hypothetical protein